MNDSTMQVELFSSMSADAIVSVRKSLEDKLNPVDRGLEELRFFERLRNLAIREEDERSARYVLGKIAHADTSSLESLQQYVMTSHTLRGREDVRQAIAARRAGLARYALRS